MIEYAEKYPQTKLRYSKNSLFKIFILIIKIYPRFAEQITKSLSIEALKSLVEKIKQIIAPLVEDYERTQNCAYETRHGKPFWVCQALYRNDGMYKEDLDQLHAKFKDKLMLVESQ